MLRYSLTSLLAAVVCVSIYCAGLAQGTGYWPHACILLTIAIMMFFVLAAIYWRGSWRAFAVGFSVVGWLYFGLAFTWLGDSFRDRLLTQTALQLLYSRMHPPQVVGSPVAGALVSVAPAPQPIYVSPPTPNGTTAVTTYYSNPMASAGTWVYAPMGFAVPQEYFLGIGHGLWIVLLGTLGGLVAQIMYRRNQRSTEPHSPAIDQVDRLGPRSAGQTGHPQDVAGQPDQEPGA